MNYNNEQDIFLKWVYFSENEDHLEKFYKKLKKDFDLLEPDYGFREYVERNRFSEKSINYIEEINKEISERLERELSKVRSLNYIKNVEKFDEYKSDFLSKEILLNKKVPLDYKEKESNIKKLVNKSLNIISNPKVKIALATAGIGAAAASGVGPVALSLLALSKGTSIWLSSGGAEKLAEKLDPSLNNFIKKNNIPEEEPSKYKKMIANIVRNNKFKFSAGIALGIIGMSASSIATAMTDLSLGNIEIQDGVSNIISNSIENNREIMIGVKDSFGNPVYSGDNYGYTEKTFDEAYIESQEKLKEFEEIDSNFIAEGYNISLREIISNIKEDVLNGDMNYNNLSPDEKIKYINEILESKGLDSTIRVSLPAFEPEVQSFEYRLEDSVEISETPEEVKTVVKEDISKYYPEKLEVEGTWKGEVYTVEKGDSIWKIARNSFSEGEIEELAKNNLSASASPEQIKTESLKLINERVKEIVLLNDQIKNPDYIFPDQEIKMPNFKDSLSTENIADLKIIENYDKVNSKILTEHLPVSENDIQSANKLKNSEIMNKVELSENVDEKNNPVIKEEVAVEQEDNVKAEVQNVVQKEAEPLKPAEESSQKATTSPFEYSAEDIEDFFGGSDVTVEEMMLNDPNRLHEVTREVTYEDGTKMIQQLRSDPSGDEVSLKINNPDGSIRESMSRKFK